MPHHTGDRTRHIGAAQHTAAVTIAVTTPVTVPMHGCAARDLIKQQLFDAANAVFGAAELLQCVEQLTLSVGAQRGGYVLRLVLLRRVVVGLLVLVRVHGWWRERRWRALVVRLLLLRLLIMLLLMLLKLLWRRLVGHLLHICLLLQLLLLRMRRRHTSCAGILLHWRSVQLRMNLSAAASVAIHDFGRLLCRDQM